MSLKVNSDNSFKKSSIKFRKKLRVNESPEDLARRLGLGIEEAVELSERRKHPLKHNTDEAVSFSFDYDTGSISGLDLASAQSRNVLSMVWPECDEVALERSADIAYVHNSDEFYTVVGTRESVWCCHAEQCFDLLSSGLGVVYGLVIGFGRDLEQHIRVPVRLSARENAIYMDRDVHWDNHYSIPVHIERMQVYCDAAGTIASMRLSPHSMVTPGCRLSIQLPPDDCLMRIG